MAKKNVEELVQLAGQMFKDHHAVNSLFQTIAEHFYPQRADFTITRNVGTELADNLLDSYPLLMARDLGNSISSVLRDGEWYEMGSTGEPDHNGFLWLDEKTVKLRSIMYRRDANFVKATKQGDHDYTNFGQAVLSCEPNRKRDGLLFRDWHLRDCAWFDDETGQVGGVCRQWRPSYYDVKRHFGDNTPPKILEKCGREPFRLSNLRHFMLPADMYGDDEITDKFPYVSLYVDVENTHLIEAVGQNHKHYIVPRFQTISGSPYAYSPATVIGLPDARVLQAMTHTLMEAAERYSSPPILATSKAVRGDVDLSPNGITWIDKEYDERMGASMRPLYQDRGGFPIGHEMRTGIQEALQEAFFLTKINLPDVSRDMTAYEFSERMKQFRRENLPLFAPIEAEYNGALCEEAFEVSLSMGLLGSQYDIPESLQDTDVEFKFVSPLTHSEEEEKAAKFSHTAKLLGEAWEFDSGIGHEINLGEALRDATRGLGAPQSWLNDPELAKQLRDQAQAQQALEQLAPMAEAAGA